MKTSETITKIAPALLKAQIAITFAVKNENNPFFKSKYADLPTVIDAVKPALNDAGIVFLQTPSPSDDGKVYLTTRLLHESGEWIEDVAVSPIIKQDPQGLGSAITYLRRYSLASIIGLYQDDDDGNRALIPPKLTNIFNLNSEIEKLKECSTYEALKAEFYDSWTAAKKTGIEANTIEIKAVYDDRKLELEELGSCEESKKTQASELAHQIRSKINGTN